MQRNCMGLKITVCLCSWGKFQTQKIQRNQKNQLPLFSNYHFWGPWSKNGGWGAKAGYCVRPLHTPPPKEWANHLSQPSGETPGHTPPLSPYKEQACHPSGSKHRNMLLVLRPRPLPLQDPSEKALPEFPVWPRVNFYWWMRPRTLVSNTLTASPDHPPPERRWLWGQVPSLSPSLLLDW